MPFASRAALFTLVVLAPFLASSAHAQTPAAYETTPHGRILACFGEAYALVELVDVATQNLAQLTLEVQRPAESARPGVASGMSMAGALIDQRQSLDVAERLLECTEGAARRATPDGPAGFAAAAVREEIDVAIMMADGFTSDYQKVAARLLQFFSDTNEAGARNNVTRSFGRFGEELRGLLTRSRTAIDTVIARSGPLNGGK